MESGSEEKIDSYVDRTGFQSDTKFVLEQLNQIFEAYKRLSEIKLNFASVEGLARNTQLAKDAAAQIDKMSKANENLAEATKKAREEQNTFKAGVAQLSESITENIRQQVEYKNRLAEIAAQLKSLKAQQDLIAKTPGNDEAKQQIKDRIVALEQERSQIKILNQEISRFINNQIKGAQSVEGTLKAMRAELDRLRNIRDTQLVVGTEDFDKAQAEILQLNDAIKELEAAGGDFRRNVGNYQGSAKIIVESLAEVEKKIDELKQKQQGLQDLSRSNPIGFKLGGQKDLDDTTAQLKTLEVQAKALQGITANPQFLNIASKVGETNKELRFFTQRLNELEDAGLKNSQVYKDVQKRLAELADQIGDTKEEIKALASDTRSFDLFAGSVAFAADTFQTAAGAAVLFGASEEDAARATATLTAVMSISNGVKGIANELTTKGTAANKVYAFVQGLVSTSLDKTAASAVRLKAALGLLGIALTVVGAIVIALSQLNKSLSESNEKRKIFNDIQKKAVENYGAEITRLQLLKKIILDTTVTIDKRRTAVKEYNKIADTSNKIDEKSINNSKLIEAAINRQIELIKKRGLARAAESVIAEKAENLFLKQVELESKFPEFGEKALAQFEEKAQNIVDQKSKIAGIKTVPAKELLAFADFPEEEIKKMAAKNSRLSILLDKDTRTLLAGIRKQQQNFLDLRKNKFGGHTAVGLIVEDIEQATADLDQAVNVGLKFLSDVGGKLTGGDDNDADNERARRAALELFKFRQGLIIEENKRISELELYSAGKRAEALQKAAEAEKKILLAQAAFDLQQKDITADEKIRIQEQYAQNVLNIELQLAGKLDRLYQEVQNREEQRLQETLDRGAEIEKRFKEDDEKKRNSQLENLRENLEQQLDLLQIGNDIELTRLNEKFAKGLLSQEKYEEAKKKIIIKHAAEALRVQIEAFEKILKIQEAAGIDTTESRKQISALKKELSQLNVDSLDNLSALGKALKQIAEIYTTVTGLIDGVLEIAATNQMNRIQDELDLLEKKKAREIDLINQTVQNEEEAAARIAIIEARSQTRREQLELRQRQIEQRRAIFQKAATIGSIVLEGALAVTRALPDIGRAIVVGALAAAQLAIAIATPIPRYKTGKNIHDNYEGPAVVGDGGRSELIVREDGSMEVTDKKPQLTYVGKNDIIYPDAEAALKSALAKTDKIAGSGPVNVTAQMDVESVKHELRRGFTSLNRTIKNKTENHFHQTPDGRWKMYMQQNGGSFIEYLNSKV